MTCGQLSLKPKPPQIKLGRSSTYWYQLTPIILVATTLPARKSLYFNTTSAARLWKNHACNFPRKGDTYTAYRRERLNRAAE